MTVCVCVCVCPRLQQVLLCSNFVVLKELEALADAAGREAHYKSDVLKMSVGSPGCGRCSFTGKVAAVAQKGKRKATESREK